MIDLVVIGGGLAGPFAALLAAEAGLKVRVVTQGFGITHWHAGTIDLLGYHPLHGSTSIDDPLAFKERLEGDEPTHPYARVDEETIRAALDAFAFHIRQAGLEYVGSSDGRTNLSLPSPVGAPRPVYLAPRGQVNGNLSDERPMLIAGFDGLRDFYPKLIAENLDAQGIKCRWVQLPVSLVSDRRGPTPMEIARALDDPERVARFADALKSIRRDDERIGLPAVLGLDDHPRVLTYLEDSLGVPIFEIPTLPPSVAGIRLFRALQFGLAQRGVSFETGMNVINFHADEKQIQWVESETSSRPLRHRGQRFLLATGGLLGGGFNSNHEGRVWETIFDLPLTVPQDRRRWFRPLFLNEDQPVFQGGIEVNSRFQPIVPGTGELPYENLWVAGGALAHADPIRERSLEGIAIVSAFAAIRSLIA